MESTINDEHPPHLSPGLVAEEDCVLDLERTLIGCILQSLKRPQEGQNQATPPSLSFYDSQSIVDEDAAFRRLEEMWFRSPRRLSRQHVRQADESRTCTSKTLEIQPLDGPRPRKRGGGQESKQT